MVASLDRAGTSGGASHPGVREYDFDVTDESSVAEVVRQLTADLGTADVTVNAAGIIGPAGASHTASLDDFNVIFDVNVKGVWLMTKYIVPG